MMNQRRRESLAQRGIRRPGSKTTIDLSELRKTFRARSTNWMWTGVAMKSVDLRRTIFESSEEGFDEARGTDVDENIV